MTVSYVWTSAELFRLTDTSTIPTRHRAGSWQATRTAWVSEGGADVEGAAKVAADFAVDVPTAVDNSGEAVVTAGLTSAGVVAWQDVGSFILNEWLGGFLTTAANGTVDVPTDTDDLLPDGTLPGGASGYNYWASPVPANADGTADTFPDHWPDGAVGFQYERDVCAATGAMSLTARATSGTGGALDPYTTCALYEAPISGGHAAWTATGGDLIESVSQVTAHPHLADVPVQSIFSRVALPDRSAWAVYGGGSSQRVYAVKALPVAIVDGLSAHAAAVNTVFGRPLLTLNQLVTVPRYRWIFPQAALPPLRYYPRDDAVGGAPRTNRASTSRQSSARQGWTNTYR